MKVYSPENCYIDFTTSVTKCIEIPITTTVEDVVNKYKNELIKGGKSDE